MSGKYGSTSITISYDAAPGGSLTDVTAHILSIGGVKLDALTQETQPFGQAYPGNIPTGTVKVPDIEVMGRFDTTASTGPHVVFGTPDDSPQDATRTLTIVYGDSKTFTMETRLASYEVLANAGNLTDFKAVIRQAGAGAWS